MEKMGEFRKQINEIDERIIELLGRRFKIIRTVGFYKKEQNIPMMQSKRVDEVKNRCATLGLQFELDAGFIKNLYGTIIDEACRVEDLIIDK